MNKSATTIPAAVTALGVAAVYAIGEWVLKNEDVLTLAAILLGLTALAIGFTWGIVEMFKRLKFDPDTRTRLNQRYTGKVRDPDWKKRDQVYLFAVTTGFLSIESMGSVFLLMDGATRNMIIVVAVLWTFYAAAGGLLIPILYRVFFYRDEEVV